MDIIRRMHNINHNINTLGMITVYHEKVVNYGFYSSEKQDSPYYLKIFYNLIAIIINIIIFYKMFDCEIMFLFILSMAINFIERIINGYVTDYILIKFIGYQTNYFNIADMLIYLFMIYGYIKWTIYLIMNIIQAI